MGETIVKHNARKVRRLHQDRVLAGFAGAGADALTLFDRFEAKLQVVADRETSLVVSGTGDVIEPEDGCCAIGSGGNFALAAARALLRHSALDARTIVEESLRIAAGLCVYTNEQLVVEELEGA
jgi:ATP-dependent HslUV protease subunit HslV